MNAGVRVDLTLHARYKSSLAILLSSAAIAASIDGGVQVAAFQSGFEFVEERFTGEVYAIDMPLVNQEDVACYD